MNFFTILLIVIIIYYFLTSSVRVKKSPNMGLTFLEAKYLISLLAKVAKSDGRVNEFEANLISHILDDLTVQINGTKEDREELKKVYNIEKENIYNAYDIAKKYQKKFNLGLRDRVGRVYFFLNIAYIDGNFSKAEQDIISKICEGLGIHPQIQNEIFARFQKDFKFRGGKEQNYYNKKYIHRKDPYKILGLQKGAKFEDVKKRYRELVRKYHPDILMGRGADEEIIEAGTKRLQEINEAYEEIRKL
ncbi:DnaJ-like membrane chaperone protein [Campylobacter blaseri]|uniref:J domain-containing protein n=1 Tax=Campylobacter blaseri TaxID=2042961 RepID=A0A2P8QZP6_9BACT|nr:TerB family tellurite resistance protein [Campylobacter blaseri]PSM51712.1 hypothetical protein CQ405_06155 [Campylobacter blaseri]PSM53503.1 hypothetical protein CRN67_06160 [Campylobacter blaseri]QKF86308.1 DnaJ-like membrane chaperone protein [Campylobacter blaseri]